ncbi:MAG TPA: hypothetical protein VF982_10830 [Anaerolineales bacterium]
MLPSGLLAAWICGATLVWNIGWLAAFLITRLTAWIPMLHHVMPFVIGIA